MSQDNFVATFSEEHATCWGCGLRLVLPSYSSSFKCGWCGAITSQNTWKCKNMSIWWRHLRDRCFVCVLIIFMLFMICGGIWAMYPVVFSVGYFCGTFHCTLAIILSVATLLSFSLAAFRCAGRPPRIVWGSYPVVGKDGLENFTFCSYCSKPKSPRTHHCSTCGMCILDMDHHCPFIGNCVGAENHRHFIVFLISAVVSTIYVALMSAYLCLRLWPATTYRGIIRLKGGTSDVALRAMVEVLLSLLSSTMFLSTRGLVLVYLFVASLSVLIGLSVLLWQQLWYIYRGKTYLGHLRSDGAGERDCRNLRRFFGCSCSVSKCLSSFRSPRKIHHP